jgi:hypothetical protein
MNKYAVEVTDAAMAAIHAQARYIAVEQAQPVNAQSWLGAVWDAIDALETFPRAHPIAEENADVGYEVRFVRAGRATRTACDRSPKSSMTRLADRTRPVPMNGGM